MSRISNFIAALLGLVALFCSSCTSQKVLHNLSFRPDGTFRILQLSDLHLQMEHPDQVADVFERMSLLAEQEDPDLIAVTGDLIYSYPGDRMMQMIADKLDSLARPWVIVYGNHDHECGFTHAQLAKIIVTGKYSLNTLGGSRARGASGFGGASGAGDSFVSEPGSLADFCVPVYKTPGRAGGDRAPIAYLYFLDSHAYGPDPAVSTYAWFSDEQVAWVRSSASAHPDIPSLAFFHIPFPEYSYALSTPPADLSSATSGLAPDATGLTPDLSRRYPESPVAGSDPFNTPSAPSSLRGTFGEWVCCPTYNSGMFDAMLSSGFVATFCGHDHDNDYQVLYPAPRDSSVSRGCSVSDADGPIDIPDGSMLLCYGRYSGSDGEYNHLPKGARVIVLHDSPFTLETWARNAR